MCVPSTIKVWDKTSVGTLWCLIREEKLEITVGKGGDDKFLFCKLMKAILKKNSK